MHTSAPRPPVRPRPRATARGRSTPPPWRDATGQRPLRRARAMPARRGSLRHDGPASRVPSPGPRGPPTRPARCPTIAALADFPTRRAPRTQPPRRRSRSPPATQALGASGSPATLLLHLRSDHHDAGVHPSSYASETATIWAASPRHVFYRLNLPRCRLANKFIQISRTAHTHLTTAPYHLHPWAGGDRLQGRGDR